MRRHNSSCWVGNRTGRACGNQNHAVSVRDWLHFVKKKYVFACLLFGKTGWFPPPSRQIVCRSHSPASFPTLIQNAIRASDGRRRTSGIGSVACTQFTSSRNCIGWTTTTVHAFSIQWKSSWPDLARNCWWTTNKFAHCIDCTLSRIFSNKLHVHTSINVTKK